MKKNILNGLTIFIVTILLLSVSTSTFATSKEQNEEITDTDNRPAPKIEMLKPSTDSSANLLSLEKTEGINVIIDEHGGRIEPFIPNPEELVSPNMIVDKDERKPVANAQMFPYSAICYVETTFPDAVVTGTATLVSKNLLITAGHMVYDTRKGGMPLEIKVYPGRNGSFQPSGVGVAYANGIFAADRWVNNLDISDDWGCIRIDKDYRIYCWNTRNCV